MHKFLVLFTFIIFLLLNSNHVLSLNYEVSAPSIFIDSYPQVILLNITDTEQDFEGSITVILETQEKEHGLIYVGDEWKDFSKYPISINGQNGSDFYSEIIFNASGLTDGIKEGVLKILLKNENGSEKYIYTRNITIFEEDEGGNIEFFCEIKERSFIEIIDHIDPINIIHRYKPEQYETGTKNYIYYKLPSFRGDNLSFIYSCIDLISEEISFSVSGNETKRFGNLFDMKLELILNEKIFPKIKYENIFKIINNDHKAGEKENIEVFVNYSVRELAEGEVQLFNFTKSGINSYSATGTGELILDEGDYEICGSINTFKANGSKAVDPAIENNLACRNIKVEFSKSNISCNSSIYWNTESIYTKKKNKIW